MSIAVRTFQSDCHTSMTPKEVRFSPYSLNGGTIVAVAGENYAVIASDTRLSEGFNIHTRDCTKAHKMTDKAMIGMCGFHGDILTLKKTVEARLQMYEHEHNHQMSTPALAAMLSTILYYRRFFPYYVNNIVAGLDGEGKGCVFSYDPIGSYEREMYSTGGTASALLHPLLDNQIALKNQEGAQAVALSEEKAVALVKDVMISAAERDIYTGDAIMLTVINKNGMRDEKIELRKD